VAGAALFAFGGVFDATWHTLFGIENARPDGIHLSQEASDELARQWLGPQVLDAASTGGGGPIIGNPGA